MRIIAVTAAVMSQDDVAGAAAALKRNISQRGHMTSRGQS
jgi:hypothetical protein